MLQGSLCVYVQKYHDAAIACVRGSPIVPLVAIIFTICTNVITNGTIGNKMVQMVKW